MTTEEKVAGESSELGSSVETAGTGLSAWRRFARALGPGLITGASDDDPSGIATYAQAGAQFRYSTLWTVIVTLPLMMAVQEICDRTALATGDSLGRLARRKYARVGRSVVLVLLVALLFANALNIAADLMAVGQGMQMLHAGAASVWAAVAGLTLTCCWPPGRSSGSPPSSRCCASACSPTSRSCSPPGSTGPMWFAD